MLKIFISHSWQGQDIIASRKLAEYLKRDGMEIWIDYEQIGGGDSVYNCMSEGLEWCDYFIIFWSKNAASSSDMELEWQAAKRLKRKIIFCLLDDTKVPVIISNLLYRDFRDFESGYKLLSIDLKFDINRIKTKSQPGNVLTSFSEKKLYKEPRVFSIKEAKTLIKQFGFYDSAWNITEVKCLNNILEEHTIEGDEIVLDKASGRMWQKNGSENPMRSEAATSWIDKQNEIGYAGNHDWRLPNLEEAMAVMSCSKNKWGLHISEAFGYKQTGIWTSDIITKDAHWVVFYNIGSCSRKHLFYNEYYVRAVR